jgi:hypothetical protein
MSDLSQRTVGVMIRILQRLCTPPDDDSLPIIEKDDLYLELYQMDFDRKFLDTCKGFYGWNFNALLPQLHDGQFYLVQSSFCTMALRPARQSANPDKEEIRIGRAALLKLAEYVLNTIEGLPDRLGDLKEAGDYFLRNLEMDGYAFVGQKLIPSESAVVNQPDEVSLLRKLINEAGFSNETTIVHHYTSGEQLYADGKWDSCIGEWRKFYEQLLRDIAELSAQNRTDVKTKLGPMADVLEYLTELGFLDKDERTAVGAAWGFLSSGSHPGIALPQKAHAAMIHALSFGQILVIKFLDWRRNNFHGFSPSA